MVVAGFLVFIALSASTFIFATVFGQDRDERLGLGADAGPVAAIGADAPLPDENATPTFQPSPAASAVASAAPPPASPAPSPAGTDKITTLENKVTALINKERAAAGCKIVTKDDRLWKAARAHSADMAKNNYFSHTGRNGSSFVDRAVAAGYPRQSVAAENIAYGYATAEAVVDGWMNSDGHRANILNCSHKTTGLGLAYRNKTPYWTQVFGR